MPIYIRTGKNLPVTATEVMVQFKRPPRETFGERVPGNSAHLRFRLSPDVAIGMGLRVKEGGERMIGRDMELMLTAQAGGLPPALSAAAGRRDAREGRSVRARGHHGRAMAHCREHPG